MVNANFFCHQKKCKVKLNKVRERLRPLILRFRALATPLDHLSVNGDGIGWSIMANLFGLFRWCWFKLQSIIGTGGYGSRSINLSRVETKAKKKCHLFQKKVLYLRQIVSEKGIETDPEKVKKVQNWPIPSTVKEVRSFLGLCNYYRRFMKDFAKIASPLH